MAIGTNDTRERTDRGYARAVVATLIVSLVTMLGRVAIFGLGLVLMVALLVLLDPRPAHAVDLTVNSTNDPGTGGCNSTECTLREAIVVSNDLSTAETIEFDITTGSSTVKTISPTKRLPTITDNVTVDGYTQPGAEPNDTITNANSAVLKIELNGTSAPSNAFGLAVSGPDAAGTTIKGLAINRFGDVGVFVNARNTVIEGNFIGTNVAGTADLGNGANGVTLLSSGNVVGGPADAAQNVISGNDRNGVAVKQSSASGNTISNNHIGTDADAGEDLGNSESGVSVENAPGNTVGGSSADGTLNIISGNDEHGVEFLGVDATDSRVVGNLIGVNRNGNGFSEIGNTLDGVLVSSTPQVTIGGTEEGQGNTISDNGRHGVQIAGSSATFNTVVGNRIGTNNSGSSAFGNAQDGVRLENASDTTVGDVNAGARNIISGNDRDGVHMLGSGSTDNQLLGNFIGTDANGTADLGNADNGVLVRSAGNLIGGTVNGSRNVISGNDQQGIRILGGDATDNRVQGNFIGTDKNGTAALRNRSIGVLVQSGPDDNLIGGTQAGARNVISANGDAGVILLDRSTTENITGNQVLGNFIGTEKDGTADLGNAGDGVSLEGNVSQSKVAGNTISGNGFTGVEIVGPGATANKVQGNSIGTGASGTADLGNDLFGVFVFNSPSNFVGGTVSGEGNTIAFNGQDGVVITGSEATANRILRNSIFSNAGLGIDLQGGTENAAGATKNDARDPDTGPNNLQNKPVLTSFSGLTIKGKLNSTPNKTFVIQFFANTSGNEGKSFLGQKSVTTNQKGNVTFTFSAAAAPIGTKNTTATATRNGNTSEFSAPRAAS